MPARFFLNTLIDEAKRQLKAPSPGAWMAEGPDERFLVEFAADIEIPKGVDDREQLERVPSIFAWPIQYARALQDLRHPLHRTVIPEWRGLLATFALQEALSVRVEVKEVEIPEREAPDEPRFVTMLRNELPRPEVEWSLWRLLYVNRELIGATSPWTIVYTPADYSVPLALDFQKDGRFTDPTEHYRKLGGADELIRLAEWVRQVLETFDWGMARHGGHPEGVQLALRAWRDDLRDAIREVEQRGARMGAAQLGWRLDTRRTVDLAPYSYFLASVVGDGTQPESDLLLAVRPGLPHRVLAVSERGVDPKARVHGSIFGGSVDVENLPSPEGGPQWRVRGGGTVPYGYVIPERAFFPSRLAAFVGPDDPVVPEALAVPLTPRFFELFDYGSVGPLDEILTMRVEGQGLTVELRLPLQNGERLPVGRRYDFTRDLMRISNPAVFAVWPDFYAPDWKDNFAFYAHDGSDVAVRPLTASGGLLAATSSDDRVARVWEVDAPSIGFGLFEPSDRATGKPGAAVGVVLRQELEPQPPVDGRKSWRVAVDFGTSSSHIVVDSEGGTERLLLEPRPVILFARDPQGGLRTLVKDVLFPDWRVELPSATLLARSRASIKAERRVTMERVPWFRVFAAGVELSGSLEDVSSEVKWHGETGERAPLRDYLRGLVRMVLAEARAAGVGNVTFAWSYPLSLPDPSQQAMARFWTALGREFGGRQPAEVNASEGTPESEAVCRYLAANFSVAGLTVLASDLSVVVDVGGGSTDVGFWKDGKLVDQFSTRIAGNVLLVPFCESKSFVTGVGQFCYGREFHLTPVLDQAFRKKPAVMVNALLTEVAHADPHDPDQHPVPKNIFLAGVEEEAPWKYVRTVIYIFFAGLGFMIGVLARRHVAEQSGLKLYFGGRGASLLTWLTPRREQRARLLQQAVTAGLEMEPAVRAVVEMLGPLVRPHRGLQLKDEVARGLLAPRSEELGAVRSRNRTPLGEILWEGRSWDTEVTVEDLRELRFPPVLDGYMTWFLNYRLQKGPDWLGMNLGLDEANLGQLGRVDRAVVEQLLRKDPTVLQPVLAYELEAVINKYVELARASAG